MHKTFTIGILAMLSLYLSTMTPAVYAESSRTIIHSEADVFVYEGDPDRNAAYPPINYLLQAGFRDGGIVSYLRFDLNKIPRSNLSDIVEVDSAELRMLAQSTFGTTDRFFVTTNYCDDNSWTDTEITWNKRVCRDSLMGEDSVVVDAQELPKVYAWDVTRSITNARAEGHSRITFVITAFPLSVEHDMIERDIVPGQPLGPKDNQTYGFVRFWSKEREYFGISAAPTLIVAYTTSPSVMINSLNIIAIVLPILGAVWGGLSWIRGRLSSKNSKNSKPVSRGEG